MRGASSVVLTTAAAICSFGVACVGSDAPPPGGPAPDGGGAGSSSSSSSSSSASSSGASASSSGASSGSSGTTSSSGASSSGTGSGAKLAFVTSQTFTGSSFKGIDGADAACATAAAAGSKTGGRTFKAWIADQSTSPLTRFTTMPAAGYVTTGGRVIVQSWSDLVAWNVTLSSPIDHDENGAAVGSEQRVWTNVSPTGAAFTTGPNTDCNGWNDATQSGLVGNATLTDAQWTELASGTIGCGASVRLYCFEQ